MDPLRLEPAHSHLLRAALLPGGAGAAAYAAWKAMVPFDDVDPESYRLLPALQRNLQSLQVEDELASRLRGVYRRTWYANQLALPIHLGAIGALERAGASTRVLGGPLAQLHYSADPGFCPLDGADVLVRDGDLPLVLGLLEGNGWTHTGSGGLDSEDSVLKHGQGGYLTVRTRIIHGAGCDDDHLWQRPVAAAFGGLTCRLLNPTDHILFLAEYGLRGGQPPLRWLPDAALLLRRSPAFDWADLAAEAQRRDIRHSLLALLGWLSTTLDLAPPEEFMEQLALPHPEPAWDARAGLRKGSVWRLPQAAAMRILRLGRQRKEKAKSRSDG